ncbi:MAG: MBL fold metallo-hydrolase [Burkholderiaceae bacterium]|nr:MBL fold metallo-hydrolase [Burkholderiaceae bacterium]
MRTDEDLGSIMKPATLHTCRANAAAIAPLNFGDEQSFEDARRGFIGTVPDARVLAADGRVLWDMSSFAFLETDEVPDSVNASLWRQARLNNIHGLFEVCPGIYQVRGFDVANMTIIEGETGVVVIDPLTFVESAATALALYRAHRGERAVRAVIYSHSHVDHYAGVEGVMTPADAAEGRIEVIAPEGFLAEAISENVLAGVPMRRRVWFQYGITLEPGPRGFVDAGLGKMAGRGTGSLIPPTRVITEPTETHVVDGVEIVFQLTPGTEAPAEMNFFFPGFKVLNLAENGCHTMHNLCPLRGAKTRDSLAWSKYLDAALDLFIDDTDVVIAQHHWPTWGRERVRRFITEQRDMYRFLHDQTLRLMSHGRTPNEISNEFRTPASLADRWHIRPYYGALAHNVRAVYAHYLGPYDGNPTSLDPLTPEDGARKYVEYMGGADAVLERARRDFDAGQYRWVVQVTHHLVFADPANRAARELGADAMEQLGYQSESGSWRSAYLLGAKELRRGKPRSGARTPGLFSPRVLAAMPVEMVLDFLAIRVNAERAEGLRLLIDWVMTDEDSIHRVTLSNSALSHRPGTHGGAAQARILMDRQRIAALVNAGTPLDEAVDAGLVPHAGDAGAIRSLFALFDRFDPAFAVLEP